MRTAVIRSVFVAGTPRWEPKTFDLPEGTIYPALHRLEQAGLLVSHWVTSPFFHSHAQARCRSALAATIMSL